MRRRADLDADDRAGRAREHDAVHRRGSAGHGWSSVGLCVALPVVDRVARGVLAAGLAILRSCRRPTSRRHAVGFSAHWSRADGAARRRARAEVVHRREAQLRREPAALRRRSRSARGLDRRWPAPPPDLRRAESRSARIRRGAGEARYPTRRSRRRVRAEHGGVGHRDAGDDEPRGGVVVVLAGLWRRGRARSLRADRAASAGDRRRLQVQREGDRPPRPRRADRRQTAGHRAGGGGAVSECRRRHLDDSEKHDVGRVHRRAE